MKYITIFVFPILLCLCFIPIKTSAQTAYLIKGFSLNQPVPESTFEKNPTDSVQSHFAIKINPLQWLWDDIRVMLEVPINKNNSLQFRVGYRNSAINPYEKIYCFEKDVFWDNLTNQNITYQYKSSGYNAGIGFNHYFKNNYYIAPSFLYKRYEFSYAPPEHWWFTEHFGSDPETPLRDNFFKTIFAIELRYGKQLYYKHFIFDIYIGAGFRNRILDNMDIYYCDGSMSNFQQSHGDNYHETLQTPTVHAGINIGVCL